jgi:transcriptional regulator with XRE-family HTH domain
MNNIGEIIKKYRLMNNLTQEELGKKMYVTKQAVSKWENGNTLPDIITIKKLSESLSIPNEEILGESVKQTQHYRKWVRILIPIVLISIFVMLFFAFDGVGFIQRRTQSGTAMVLVRENGVVVKAKDYEIIGSVILKPGQNGYSFDIDYGEVRGSIITSNGKEIEFGFVNTNNWHNVQINININNDSVSQSVIYKTDSDIIEVIETNNKFDEFNKTSVFRGGV